MNVSAMPGSRGGPADCVVEAGFASLPIVSDLAAVRGRVLDVGCGAGSVAKAVKRERADLDVVGCDVSQSALAAANVSPGGVEFKLAPAEQLPFGDGEFDFQFGAGEVGQALRARLQRNLDFGSFAKSLNW